jgi:hypothetical protein
MGEYQRVSLEDLLAEYDERPPHAERRSVVPWWARLTLLALVFGGVIDVLLRIFGLAVPYVLIASVVVAFALLRRILVVFAPPPLPPALHSPAWGMDEDPQIVDRVLAGQPVDGLLRAVKRWEQRLSWTDRDHVRFVSAVRPKLAELVYERLRQRHGIRVDDDPAAARALLGEPLWAFLRAPIDHSPSPPQLAAIVARMEQL